MTIFQPPRHTPVPPAKAGTPCEQREFARRVTAVEGLKTAQRASLAELDALFGRRCSTAPSEGNCSEFRMESRLQAARRTKGEAHDNFQPARNSERPTG